jgi:hypothetical protein
LVRTASTFVKRRKMSVVTEKPVEAGKNFAQMTAHTARQLKSAISPEQPPLYRRILGKAKAWVPVLIGVGALIFGWREVKRADKVMGKTQ